MWVDETSRAGEDFDSVSRELRADHIDFGLDHMLRAERQVRHGDLFLHAVIDAVNSLVMKAGEMQNCFTDGFAGDCTGVYRRSADDFELFDKSRAFAELHRLNRRALSRGTGAEDDEVVTFHGR